MKVDACDLDIHDHTRVQTQKEKKKTFTPFITEVTKHT